MTEEEKEVCPLLSIGKDGYVPCLREKCAWWDDVDRNCVLRVIADKVWGIYSEFLEHT